MKTAINIILSWLTCTDPTVVEKWQNIVASFWHKDQGQVVTTLNENNDGDVTITTINGEEEETTVVIEKYIEPENFEIAKILGLANALNDKVAKEAGKGLSANDLTAALKQKLDGLVQYVHPESHPIALIDGLREELDALNDLYNAMNTMLIDVSERQFLTWNGYRLFKVPGGNQIYPEAGDEIHGRGDGTLLNGDNIQIEAVNPMPDIALVVAADYKFLNSYA